MADTDSYDASYEVTCLSCHGGGRRTGPIIDGCAVCGAPASHLLFWPADTVWSGNGDCDGRVTLDDWHHQDHDEGVLAYDPTWDDCDGEGGPVKTGPRCALSGPYPYYTPCTYADCDLELGGGCVLRGQRA